MNPKKVALRKESVDRNTVTKPCFQQSRTVALRKESVDRNGHYEYITAAEPRRSPQGERG